MIQIAFVKTLNRAAGANRPLSLLVGLSFMVTKVTQLL
jgi:hypothetical protein